MRGRRRSRLVEIRSAGDKGMGVFAVRDMAPGTVIFRYGGLARWIWDIPKRKWQYCFQSDYDRYFVPRVGSVGWYFNHSCDPNCWISGSRTIVTRRRAAKGEELTFDYSTNVGWDDYMMACRCGKRNCRRVITDYSRLPSGLKQEYGAHVSPFLLRRPERRRPSLF